MKLTQTKRVALFGFFCISTGLIAYIVELSIKGFYSTGTYIR